MYTKKITKPLAQSQNKLEWQKTFLITSINDAVSYKKADTRFTWMLKKFTKERENWEKFENFLIRWHRLFNFNKSSELTTLQRKAFLILTLRNTRTSIKRAFFDKLMFEKVILLNTATFWKICMNSIHMNSIPMN